MKTAWSNYSGAKMKPLMAFSEGYKDFLNASKTEREAVKASIALAEKAGFKDLVKVEKVKAGDRVYFNNRGKSLVLFVVGKEKIEKGMKSWVPTSILLGSILSRILYTRMADWPYSILITTTASRNISG